MHTFQPYPARLFECNPFDKIGKETFALTAEYNGKVNTMTAGWGGLGVMWGSNVVYVVVRDSRYTKEFMDASDTFSLTFFDREHYHSTLKFLGCVSGRDEDKIKEARLTLQHEKGIPFFDEGNLVILCRKLSVTPILPQQFTDKEIDKKWYADKDYHSLYIGEIVEILAR
jgi:flavin reductase (DIM6/NTAB) family NADH-FMN oxidoreductase RutF